MTLDLFVMAIIATDRLTRSPYAISMQKKRRTVCKCRFPHLSSSKKKVYNNINAIKKNFVDVN